MVTYVRSSEIFERQRGTPTVGFLSIVTRVRALLSPGAREGGVSTCQTEPVIRRGGSKKSKQKLQTRRPPLLALGPSELNVINIFVLVFLVWLPVVLRSLAYPERWHSTLDLRIH